MKKLVRFVATAVVLTTELTAAEPTTGFDGVILPSVQYAHADIFYHTPSEFPPALALAEELAPGQRLDVLVLARGYAVDADSQAHVTYELSIHKPNGKVTRLPEPVTVAEKKRVDPRQLLFPTGVARFATDPGDPPGDYRLEILLHDHISGAAVNKSAMVRVADSAEALPLPADTEMLRFLTDYYQRPRPRLALSALAAFSQSAYAARKADGHGTLLGFYGQVLSDNPWLLPQFVQRLATTKDESERRLVALVLAYAKRDDPKFSSDLPRAARTALAEVRKEPIPLPSAEPTLGGQLDLEWGTFLASGRFEPVANLVAVMKRYQPYRGKLDEFKKLTVKPKTMPPDVMKDILFNTALWSLGSNAAQQKLVRYYLIGIAQSKETPPEVRAAVEEALAWRPKEPSPAATAK